MIYTSYFAKSAEDPRAVAICLYKPGWFKGEHNIGLAPEPDWFREWKDNPELGEEWYKEKYYETVLNHLDVHMVAEYMQDRVMLCYEASNKFCHRHLVAQWLQAAGYEVEEL